MTANNFFRLLGCFTLAIGVPMLIIYGSGNNLSNPINFLITGATVVVSFGLYNWLSRDK